MNHSGKNLILPICVGLISLILTCQVKAEPSKLFVRDVEFNSNSIEVGEEANIKMNIKNLFKERKCCNVTVFCGGKKLKKEEITLEPQTTVPLQHSFNTSGMPTGTYSIETIIESTEEQKLFDLGKINLTSDTTSPEATTPEATTPEATTPEATLSRPMAVDSFNSPILITLIPIGAAVSIVILVQKKRKKPQVPEEEYGVEDFPKLLGGIFNMQEKEESINSEAEHAKGKEGYIC
jgi:hypothetical protein